VAPERRFFIWR